MASALPRHVAVDTSNRFVVARGRERVFVTAMSLERCARGLSPDDAINLAAWLCAMVEDGEAKLVATMKRINT